MDGLVGGGVVIAVVVGEVRTGDIQADAMPGQKRVRGGAQADGVFHNLARLDMRAGLGRDDPIHTDKSVMDQPLQVHDIIG